MSWRDGGRPWIGGMVLRADPGHDLIEDGEIRQSEELRDGVGALAAADVPAISRR
jgi:hypothetical protein